MSEKTFVYTTYIDTTPEKLWLALTSAEFTRQYWSGTAVESDWTPGSAVVASHPDHPEFSGEVLAAEPPRRLAYTFRMPEQPASRVEYDIRPHGDTVRLTVTHDEIPDERFLRDISGGWPSILSSLKTLLERGEALAYPQWARA